MMLTQHSVV